MYVHWEIWGNGTAHLICRNNFNSEANPGCYVVIKD